MNEDDRGWAQSFLADAFWEDFSGLVNSYIKVAEGLGIDEFESQLQDKTSVYGRDSDLNIHFGIKIDAEGVDGRMYQYDTLAAAMNDETAREIFLQGRKIFYRKNNEWWVWEEGYEM